MNTTSLHIQIEPTVKRRAKETADQLGLSLSAVVKALLKQFIRTKRNCSPGWLQVAGVGSKVLLRS